MFKKFSSYIALYSAFISALTPSWGWTMDGDLHSPVPYQQDSFVHNVVLAEHPEKFWLFMKHYSDHHYLKSENRETFQKYEMEVPFDVDEKNASLQISKDYYLTLQTRDSSKPKDPLVYKDSLRHFLHHIKSLQSQREDAFFSHFSLLLKSHYLNEVNKEWDEGETTSDDTDSDRESIPDPYSDVLEDEEQFFVGHQLREELLYSPHHHSKESLVNLWSSLSKNKDVFFNLISELLNDPVVYSKHAEFIQNELTKGVEENREEFIRLKTSLYAKGLWLNPIFEDYRQVLIKASHFGDGEASYRLALLYEPDLEQISSFQVPEFHQLEMMKNGTENLRKQEPQYFVKAFEYYEKAVSQGHLYAHDRLADFLLNPREGIVQDKDKDKERAFQLFKVAAEQGLSVAQRSLGWMYFKGEVIPQNMALAKKWYKAAINQDLVFAKYEWGCLLLDPNNSEIYDPKAGLTYLKEIQNGSDVGGKAARDKIAEYEQSLHDHHQAYYIKWSEIYEDMYNHQNFAALFKAGFHMSQTEFDVEEGELHNRFAYKQNFGIETDILNESIVSLRDGNLIWTYHHHVFELLRNGDLLISGQEVDLTLENVKQLNVVNPFGRIILNKGKYAKHLCLKGRGVQLGVDAKESLLLDHICSVVFDRNHEEVDVAGLLNLEWWLNKQGRITVHKDSKVLQNGLLFLWTNNDLYNYGEFSFGGLSLGSNRDSNLKTTLFNKGVMKTWGTSSPSSKINIHRVENEGIFKIQGELNGKVDVIENILENSLFSIGKSSGLKMGHLHNRGFFELFGGRLNVDKFNQSGKLKIENAEIHILSKLETHHEQSKMSGKNITFSGPGELYLSGKVFVEEGFDICSKTFFLKDLYRESFIQHLILSDKNEKTVFHNGQGWTLQHLTAIGTDQHTLVFGEDFELAISQLDLSRKLINKGSLQADIIKGERNAKIENHGVLTVEKYIEGHFFSMIQLCGSVEIKSSHDAFIAQIRNKGTLKINEGKVNVRHIKAFDDGSSSKVKVHDLEVIQDADMHELTNLDVKGQLTSNVPLHELRLKQGVTIQSINVVLENLVMKGEVSIKSGALTIHNHLRFDSHCEILSQLTVSNARPEKHEYDQAVLTVQNINLLPKISTLHNVQVKGIANATGTVPSLGITNSVKEKFLSIESFAFQPQFLHIHGKWRIEHLNKNLEHLKLHDNSHLAFQYIDGGNRIEHMELRENAILQFLHEGEQKIKGHHIDNRGSILGRRTHLDYTRIDNRHLIYGETCIQLDTDRYQGKNAELTGKKVQLYTRGENTDSLELDDQSLIGGKDTKTLHIKTQSNTHLRGLFLASEYIRMDTYDESQKKNLKNDGFIGSYVIYEKYKDYIINLQRLKEEAGQESHEFKRAYEEYHDFLIRLANAQEAGLLQKLDIVGAQNITNLHVVAAKVMDKLDNGKQGQTRVINEANAIWVAHQDWSNYESHENGTVLRKGGGIAAFTNRGIALWGHLYNHIYTLINEEQGFLKAFHAEVGIDILQNTGAFFIDSGSVLLLDILEKDAVSKTVFLPEVSFRESGDKLRTIINAKIKTLKGSPQTVHTLHLGGNVYVEQADLTLIDLDIWGDTQMDQGLVDVHNLFVRHKLWSKDHVQLKTYHVWNSKPNSCEKTGSGYIGQLILKNGGVEQHVERLSIGSLSAQDNAILQKLHLTYGAQVKHINMALHHLVMKGEVSIKKGDLTVHDTLRFDSHCEILSQLTASDARPEKHEYDQAVLTIQNINLLPKISTLHNVQVKGIANATGIVPSLGISNSVKEKFLSIESFAFQPQFLHIRGQWKIQHVRSNFDHLHLYENSHLALRYMDKSDRIEHLKLEKKSILQFLHEGEQKINGHHIDNRGSILGQDTYLRYTSVDNHHVMYGKKRINVETGHYKGHDGVLTGPSVQLHTWGKSDSSIDLDDQSLIGGKDTRHVRIDSRSNLNVRGLVQASEEIDFILYDHQRQMKSLTNYGFIGGTYQKGDAVLGDQFTDKDLKRLKLSVCGGVHNHGKMKAIHAARYHSSHALWLSARQNSLTSFLLYTDHHETNDAPAGIHYNDHHEKSDIYIGKTSVRFKNYLPKVIPRSEITEIFSFLESIKKNGLSMLNVDHLWGLDFRIFLPFVRESLVIQGTSLTLSEPLDLSYPVRFELSKDLTFAAQFLCRGLTVRSRNMSIKDGHIVGVFGKADIHLSGELENIEGGKFYSDDDMFIFARMGIIQSGLIPHSNSRMAQWISLKEFMALKKKLEERVRNGENHLLNQEKGNFIKEYIKLTRDQMIFERLTREWFSPSTSLADAVNFYLEAVIKEEFQLNGSSIASHGQLKMETTDGDIFNLFSDFYGRNLLDIQTHDHDWTNIASSAQSFGPVVYNGRVLKHKGKMLRSIQGEPESRMRWKEKRDGGPSGWCGGTHLIEDPYVQEFMEDSCATVPSLIQSATSDVLINAQNVYVEGGDILANGKAMFKGEEIHQSTTPENPSLLKPGVTFQGKTLYRYRKDNGGERKPKDYLPVDVLGGQSITIDTSKFMLENAVARAGEDISVRARNISMSHAQHHTQRTHILPFDPHSVLDVNLAEFFVQNTSHSFPMISFMEQGVEGALQAASRSNSLALTTSKLSLSDLRTLYEKREDHQSLLIQAQPGQTNQMIQSLLQGEVHIPSLSLTYEMFQTMMYRQLGTLNMGGISSLHFFDFALQNMQQYMLTLPGQMGLNRILEHSLENQDNVMLVWHLQQIDSKTFAEPHVLIPPKILQALIKHLQADVAGKRITTFSHEDTTLSNLITHAYEKEMHTSQGLITLEGVHSTSQNLEVLAQKILVKTFQKKESTYNSYHHSDGYTDITTHCLTHYPSKFENSETTRLIAEQAILAEAPVFQSPQTFMEVEEGGHISVVPVYDTFYQLTKIVDKGGWGPTKYHDTTYRQTNHETLVAPQFNDEFSILTAPKGSINLQNPRIKGKMIIQAIDGIVKLAGSYSISVSELISQSSDAFWMSGDRESTTQKTYHNPVIEGDVTVEAKELHLELAQKTYKDVLDKINKASECDMFLTLENDVFEHVSEELYSTPSQALSIMVGIGAAIASLGAATSLGALAAEGMTGFTATATQAAVTASVMGLSSRVATLLVVNKGNLGAVQRELFSSTTVIDLTKTIAASVLTAGIATSVGASPTLNATQEALKASTSFTQSLQTLSGYMISSSAAHFVVDSVENTITRQINGNILVKGFVNSVHSAAVETVASAVCHQIGKSYPQMERTLIDEINHKLLHSVTAAGASVLMGNPDGALACAGAAMVAETVVDGLDDINRQTQQNMTHQERQAIQKMEAKKALDQKTNKSLFNFTIRNRDIASLITAFMLAFTTPDHLVAEAYQSSQRALDWNHDVSTIKAKLTEIEEEKALQEIKEKLSGHVVEGVEVNFDGTLTPRRINGLKAYRDAQIMNAQKADLVVHPPMIGIDNVAFMGSMEDPVAAFNQAYLQTQSQLATQFTIKKNNHKSGESLTQYESKVRREDRQAHQRYIKRMAGYVGGAALGVGAAFTAPISMPLAMGVGALGGALEGMAFNDYEVKSKTDAAVVGLTTLVGAAVPGSGKAIQQAVKSTLTHTGDLAVSKAVTSKMISSQSSVSKGVESLGLEVPRPTYLPKGIASDKLLKGEYRKVKGHHVHAKKAFEGHVNYDPKTGFSISDELMELNGIDHFKVTGAQKRLFKELFESGRPNTIFEHNRIAVEALMQGGCQSRDLARSMVAESLESLRFSKVREPMNIPWHNKK